MSDSRIILDKTQCGQIINSARIRKGLTWADLAQKLKAPLVWSTAALLGQHPLTPSQAQAVAAELDLGADVEESLQLQPTRGAAGVTPPADPTIYRFYEALSVYGPALKELIHENFGDGIMSAINFSLDFQKIDHPHGDRVEITFNGKFLEYAF